MVANWKKQIPTIKIDDNFRVHFMRIIISALFAIFGLTSSAVFAHHSVPLHYDLDTRDSVKGVIKKVSWRNPHSYLEVDVTNSKGEVEFWRIEMGTKNTLIRRKADMSLLKVGESVTVIGSMHRQTERQMYLRECILSDNTKFILSSTGQDISDK